MKQRKATTSPGTTSAPLARRGFINLMAQGAAVVAAGWVAVASKNGIAATAPGADRSLDQDKSQTGSTPWSNQLSAAVQMQFMRPGQLAAAAPPSVSVSNLSAGASAGTYLNLAGSGGSGQVAVYGRGYTGVSNWQDAMVIGMASVLDGGLVLCSSDKVRIQNSPGTDAMTVTGGNVGIGTTSPSAALDVVTYGNADWSSQTFRRVGEFIGNGSSLMNLILNQKAGPGGTASASYGFGVINDVLNIYHNTTNKSGGTSSIRMTISEAGNIGIGTTAPTSLLTVNGGWINAYGSSVALAHFLPEKFRIDGSDYQMKNGIRS